MSQGSENRIMEIDNRSRKNETDIEKLYNGLSELQMATDGMAKAFQMLSLQLLSSQIMNELLPRYIAGYVPGDYVKEIEISNANPDSEVLLLDKGNGFDSKRFLELSKDIANIILQSRAQAIKKQSEEQNTVIAPGGAVTPNPGIRLVK